MDTKAKRKLRETDVISKFILPAIGAQIYSEDLRQKQQALFDPLFAVIKTAARKFIFAAEKGATHAAGNAVVIGCGFGSNQLLAGQGHIIVLDE